MILFIKIISLKRQLFCCLLFFIAACSNNSPAHVMGHSKKKLVLPVIDAEDDFKTIAEARQYIKQSDLILRTGRDFTSDIMRRVSLTDKTYSHCGIASFENDTLFVYHAIGGEWNPDQKLRRDPFDVFCNPYENKGFGIFRYGLNKDEQVKILNHVRNFYNDGIMFDMKFDLDTNDRMYCSEFVYKTLELATDHKIQITIDTFNSKKFIAIDNLFLNPSCRQIKRVKFEMEGTNE